MEIVSVQPRSIDEYIECAGIEAVQELKSLAEPLRGLRVLHVNATHDGGGVAEILRAMMPLLSALGLEARWQTITAEPDFFVTTKAIHNGLQGAKTRLNRDGRQEYLAWQQRIADELPTDYDVIVIHDPQPLGLLQAAGKGTAYWISRLHIDSSRPDPGVWAFLQPMMDGYDRVVFTLEQFVPAGVDRSKVRIVAPAIDPLTPKNRPIPVDKAVETLSRLGIDPARPLIAQISRFDPWKDPIGVIDCFRLVRQRIAGLQLALLGVIEAQDDPEAVGMAERVRRHAGDDADIHIYTDPRQVDDPEVGAVQQQADVVLQKSLREGFALTVSEAVWKATPVVAGRVGGIPLQMDDCSGGFLVDSVESAAERTTWLLENPPDARDRFLVTRLLGDELRIYTELVSALRPSLVAAAV